MFLVALDDLQVVRGVGLGDFYHVVCGIHRRLSDFIHSIVVHRRDESTRVGEIGFGRILLFTRFSGLGLIWFPLPFFFSVIRIFHLVVLGYYLILPGLTRNSERPGFPIFVALGKGRGQP